MSYPIYPNNRLLVKDSKSAGAVFEDLTEKFKMVLTDNYTLGLPALKTYMVDIPGGDGKLDLTDALLGRVAYGNRQHEFTFYIFGVENVSETKSAIVTFLHGKAFDYQITMDPGYTYHGRFTVSSIANKLYNLGQVLSIKLTIDANPYKIKDGQKYI